MNIKKIAEFSRGLEHVNVIRLPLGAWQQVYNRAEDGCPIGAYIATLARGEDVLVSEDAKAELDALTWAHDSEEKSATVGIANWIISVWS